MEDTLTKMAKAGYDAYGAAADWKNYAGKPMPQWDELPQHIRDKWKVASHAIITNYHARIVLDLAALPVPSVPVTS